jgi:hypothetical protein
MIDWFLEYTCTKSKER